MTYLLAFGIILMQPWSLAVFAMFALAISFANRRKRPLPRFTIVLISLAAIPVAVLATLYMGLIVCGSNRHDSTKIMVQTVAVSVCGIKRACGRHADSIEAIAARAQLVVSPNHPLNDCELYSTSELKVLQRLDAWNRPLIYDLRGQRPAIMSLGSDGVIGGEKSAEDIVYEADCERLNSEFHR